MSYNYRGAQGSEAWSWFIQRISGMILAAILMGHFILMHYNMESGHTYDAVLARMQNPFYQVLQIIFVILALYHGLQGIWNIIRDFNFPSWINMTSASILILLGISFGSLGIATILHF